MGEINKPFLFVNESCCLHLASLTAAEMDFAHLSKRILMMVHRVCISFVVPVNFGKSKCIKLSVYLKTFFFFLPHAYLQGV